MRQAHRRPGAEPLTADEVGLRQSGWTSETPLWAVRPQGVRGPLRRRLLGKVGGRVVGETLAGIIDADPESYRTVDPAWTPTLPSHTQGAFGLVDILVPVGDSTEI